MPDIERYTPAQLADEVQRLADNFLGAVDEIATDNGYFEDIGEAIVSKDGGEMPDKSAMAGRIAALPSGATLISKTITENGVYNATDDNADGYDVVTVGVENPILYTNSGKAYTKNMVFPDTVTKLVANAYSDCSLLETVILPNSITSIGMGCFGSCDSLISVVLSNSISTLPVSTFYDSGALPFIKIPKNISEIEADCFRYCSSLKTVDLTDFDDPQNIPILKSFTAFSYTPSDIKMLVVNQEMYDVFTTATNWSNYASKFVIEGA